LHHIHTPTPFPATSLLPLVPDTLPGPVLPSCSLIL
jgi:hypothetical protein